MENSVRNFSFKNQNEENAFGAAMANFPPTNKVKYKHADYLYIDTPGIYHWKTTTNESNAGHMRSFVRLLNVSSQLYAFSSSQLKNCCLVACSMFKTIFPFTFCQDDRRIAMWLAPGHNRAAFLVPVPLTLPPQYLCYGKPLKIHGDKASHWS